MSYAFNINKRDLYRGSWGSVDLFDTLLEIGGGITPDLVTSECVLVTVTKK